MIGRLSNFGICVSLAIGLGSCLEPSNPVQLKLADNMCKKYAELTNSTITAFPNLFLGGLSAFPKEFPHMVRIGFGPLNDIQWKCGGSIISRRYILTVAHCTKTRSGEEPTFVRIGDLVLDDESDDAQPETIEIADIIRHPNFTFTAYCNDIALLRLPRNIEFNSYVRPACLNTELNIPETKAIVSGWDLQEWLGDENKKLSKMTLNLDSYEDCARAYSPTRRLSNGILNDQQICAGGKQGANDYCIGDGGSPLQVHHTKYDGMYKIIGLSAFGKGCGMKDIPEVYTRVSNYIDWIEEIAFSHG